VAIRVATLAEAIEAAGLTVEGGGHPAGRHQPGPTHPAEGGGRSGPSDGWPPPRLRSVDPSEIPDTIPDDILDDPF
jgi:hypothetical protein